MSSLVGSGVPLQQRMLKSAAWAVSAICVLPMIAAVAAAASGTLETWGNLFSTVLPGFIWNTILLVFIVGIGTAVIGTVSAWLTVAYKFPFRRVLEILLALPLAFPAFVLAYAYTDLLDHPGFVQTTLRDLMGWGPRDYYFPEIRSLGGAATMLIFVLYPYVYLLARTAFAKQSATAYFAARTLGSSSLSAFLRISIPIARPAIAGGVLLALMETIADFGTVAHFGVQTFATGIYAAWFGLGDRAAAAQLALCLLIVALLFAGLERIQRGAAKRHAAGGKVERHQRETLQGAKAWGAMIVCLIPVLVGFIIPLIVLGNMALTGDHSPFTRRYANFMENSGILAGTAAIVTVAGAVIIGFCARIAPSLASRSATIIAGIGYAVPGGVIAVGLLVPFAHLDNIIDAWAREQFGFSTGLFFTGSITLLIIAYMVRYMAAALNAFDSGISAIKINIDSAARVLGRTPKKMLWQIHLPLLRPSLLTALLIVFVDIMKELPATLIMRPFNFDTLAVQAYRLASDERLEAAAVPSLMIVFFGLLPVILLCTTINRSR